MNVDPAILQPHAISIALMHPQIAANTGNIARLCVVTGTRLHLVRPLGFVLSDRQLKRSGMDYWDRLNLTVHDDEPAFFAEMNESRCWFFTSKSTRAHWKIDYLPNDCLVFGSETHGLVDRILQEHRDRCVKIPQLAQERCLNLSTAVGIGLYEALRPK